jgi:hypothetical protein
VGANSRVAVRLPVGELKPGTGTRPVITIPLLNLTADYVESFIHIGRSPYKQAKQ